MLIKADVRNDEEYVKALTLLQVLTDHGFGIVNLHGINPTTGACTCSKGLKCEAKGKHPYRRGWQNALATTSTDVLKLLKLSTARLPRETDDKLYYLRSNLAVACGMESKLNPGKYLVVIDIDNNPEMIGKLDACAEPTVNYFTGSGGKHYLYLSDQPVNNSVSSIAPGVDVRGTGGYAIIPPSTNSKGDYGKIGPGMIIRAIPDFLRHSIASIKPQPAKKKSRKPTEPEAWTVERENIDQKATQRDSVYKLLEEATTTIPNGLRNQTLYIYLCRLRARGALKGKLFDAAREMIATRFENPETFSEHELATLVTSVAKHPPYVHTHSEMLRVFVEWAIKNNAIPEKFGKRTFDFRKEAYRLDRYFFKTELPNLVRSHVKENGCGPTMPELVEYRDQYYKALGYSTENYPKMTPTQFGCVFSHDYPFYKVFDKVRNKVRRYEWFILDKQYEEFMSKQMSLENLATSPATSPSSLPTPEEKKREKSEGIRVSLVCKGISCLDISCKGLSEGAGRCSGVVFWAQQDVWRWRWHDLTTVPRGAKVRDNDNGCNNQETQGKAVEDNDKLSFESWATSRSLGASRGGAGAWWFRDVQSGWPSLQPLWSTTHGSGLTAAWHRACLQCPDHEVGSERKDSGELSFGNDHGISHPGNVVRSTGHSHEVTDRLCCGCGGEVGSGECKLCGVDRRLRQTERSSDARSWFRQSPDHSSNRHCSIISTS